MKEYLLRLYTPLIFSLDGTEKLPVTQKGKEFSVSLSNLLGAVAVPPLADGNIFVGDVSNNAIANPLNNLKYRINLLPSMVGNVDGSFGDTTNRITIASWQQSSGSSTSYGDGVRFLALHGRAKNGTKHYASGDSAVCNSTSFDVFNIVSGDTLTVIIDGGVTQTITFTTGFTSGAATADEISIIISAQIVGAQCINLVAGNTDVLQISSDSFGSNSTVRVTGGTANIAFGFPTSTQIGVDGVDIGDGLKGLQKAWAICHDKPNDTNSANCHKHFSIEVPDSSGAMQTRMGFEYGLDISRITVSSAQFIVNENQFILSASLTSNRDFHFSKNNRGQLKSRLFVIRNVGTSGDLSFIGVNDAGVTSTLMRFERTTSRTIMNSSIQQKKGSSVARSTTLNPLCSGGNYFIVTGTGTVSYMRMDTWQDGSKIDLYFPTGVTIGHNTAGSTPGTSLPFFLEGSINFTSAVNGSLVTFLLDAVQGFWFEVNRKNY